MAAGKVILHRRARGEYIYIFTPEFTSLVNSSKIMTAYIFFQDHKVALTLKREIVIITKMTDIDWTD